MKYECCVCKGEFPAKEAVDGFARGYRVGFLCPLCGSHLQDNLIDTHWIIREGKGFVAAITTLGAIGTVAIRSINDIPWTHIAIYLLLFVVVAVYGYKKYPGIHKNPVMSTRLGPGKDS